MKQMILLTGLCALGWAGAFAADAVKQPAASASPQSPSILTAPTAGVAGNTSNLVEKGSYALGANIGNNMRMQEAEPDVDQVIQGFKDGLAGKVKMPEPELRENYMAWQRDLRNTRLDKNKKVGDAFLAKRAQEADVKKFPDGLMYKVLATGKGPQPKPDDTVSAHYRGTLIGGTEFDSSYSRGQPLKTPVRGVVPGWQEALTNMHVGDKWELYIPPQLAYGERGAGPKIAPNSTLIFEMELLGIEPPNTNAPPAPAINFAPGGSQPIRVTPNGANQPIRVQPAK